MRYVLKSYGFRAGAAEVTDERCENSPAKVLRRGSRKLFFRRKYGGFKLGARNFRQPSQTVARHAALLVAHAWNRHPFPDPRNAPQPQNSGRPSLRLDPTKQLNTRELRDAKAGKSLLQNEPEHKPTTNRPQPTTVDRFFTKHPTTNRPQPNTAIF